MKKKLKFITCNNNPNFVLNFLPNRKLRFHTCNGISREHFIIKFHFNLTAGIVILLKNHSKNRTLISGKGLGPLVESGLKDGDIIGVAYFKKDEIL